MYILRFFNTDVGFYYAVADTGVPGNMNLYQLKPDKLCNFAEVSVGWYD